MFVKLLCFLVLVLWSPALAEDTSAPEAIGGGRVVTVDKAKAYFDSGKAIFIDARNPLNYGRGHIPMAIAAPYDFKNGDGLSRGDFLRLLPAYKGFPLIFYSHGITGWKSYYAAQEAIKAGYTNVMWMREGLKSWEEKGFDVVSGQENR